MINVRHLDQGYEKASSLFDHEEQEGVSLLFDLKTEIENLKRDWVGTDATSNINDLIAEFNDLQKFLNMSLSSTSLAMQKIVEMQEIRKANFGGGQVGDVRKLKDNELTIEPVQASEKYYVDPNITTDYKNLLSICERLKKFRSDYVMDRDDIMNNWTKGNGRDKIVEVFGMVDDVSTKLEKKINEVVENLDMAIKNANLIMEK